MGNSNSTSGGHRSDGRHGGHPNHHGGQQWSHSLETPEQRNRMKRGYFPPHHRPYIGVGHPGLPQPQKVLPTSVNPTTKLLKATSNGAILHGGGTISGRKLSEMELDMRKRSTVSCPATEDMSCGGGPSSGRSTPNLMRTRRGGSSKGSSSRDYDSEPDLREVGLVPGDHHDHSGGDHSPERSVSPLPNSFTLISESPAKKQIRSRKKSKAPPPPGHPGHDPHMQLQHHQQINMVPYNINMNGHHMGQPIPYPNQLHQLQLHQQHQQYNSQQRHLLVTPTSVDGGSQNGRKKLNRLFKTKAESKSAAASPAIRSPSGSELIMNSPSSKVSRGGPMRASLDANRLIRGDKDRMSHHSVHEGVGGGGFIIQNSQSSNSRIVSSSHPIDRESKDGFRIENASGGGNGSGGGKFLAKNSNPTAPRSRLGSQVEEVLEQGPLCSPKGVGSGGGGSRSTTRNHVITNANSTTSEVTNLNKKNSSSSHAQQSAVSSSRDGGSGGGGSSSGLRQVPKNSTSKSPLPSSSDEQRNFIKMGTKSQSPNPTSGNNELVSGNSNNNSKKNESSSKKMTSSSTPTKDKVAPAPPPNNKGNKGSKADHDENGNNKKTFYFGMDMGTFKNKNAKGNQSNSNNNGNGSGGAGDTIVEESSMSLNNFNRASSSSRGASESPGPSDLHKEISRRKMIKQMEEFETKVGQRSSSRAELMMMDEDSHNNNNNSNNKSHNNNGNVNNNNINSNNIKSSSNHLNANHGNKSHVVSNTESNNIGGKVISNGANQHGKLVLSKSYSNNNMTRSESDSDGLHRRQDSGNFELNDDAATAASRRMRGTRGGNGGGGGGGTNGAIREKESSSDLSSSDLDVPLVVTRPTLPQKRPDLPRFSPTAAWRALDSPSRVSISGRSFSSEEGLRGVDNNSGGGRIHRYTRPSAPPRVSHERSGDSGISAGDAGSPANIILPSETFMNGNITEDFSSSSPVMMMMPNNPNNHLGGGGTRNTRRVSNNPKDNLLSADRMMKCWTPEQDLDESSSDFEHDEGIMPPVPPKVVVPQINKVSGSKSSSSNNTTNNTGNGSSSTNKLVPVGAQTPPKFTTRSNLFAGKRAAAVVSDSDSKYFSSGAGGGDESNSGGGRRFYGRSTKSKHNYQGEVNVSKKRLSHHHNQSNNKYPPHHGYGGKYSNNLMSTSRKAQLISPNIIHTNNNNGFVGLDTNWFLSRSEPNSLHRIGMVSASSENLFANSPLPTEEFPVMKSGNSKRQKDAQFLAKVFPPSKKAIGSRLGSNVNSSSGGGGGRGGREVVVGSRSRLSKNEQDDEFECELHLEDEEEDSASDNNNLCTINNDPNNGKTSNNTRNNKNLISTKNASDNTNSSNKSRSSEIGYGPSSMNFYSKKVQSAATTTNTTGTTTTTANGVSKSKTNGFYGDDDDDDDQEEITREVEVDDDEDSHASGSGGSEDDDDDEEELMRDDLFDYLDQYEEGEFERDQELTTGDNNINTVNNNNFAKNNIATGGGGGNHKTHINIVSGSNLNISRPFSHHIMYLPSYDSRRLQSNSGSNWRRARSVDHLDTSEVTLFRRTQRSAPYLDVESEDNRNSTKNWGSSNNKGQQRYVGGGQGRSNYFGNGKGSEVPLMKKQEGKVRKNSEPCYPDRCQSVPPFEDEDDGKHLSSDVQSGNNSNNSFDEKEQERRLQNKKKFKFQSTLRVMERKKIEKELTREARQREEERLREIEAMKKVEEEFQKKRAKEKLEAQAATALANLNGKDELPPNHNVNNHQNNAPKRETQSQHQNALRSDPKKGFKGSNGNIMGERVAMALPGGMGRKNVLSHQPSTSSAGSSSAGGGMMMGGFNKGFKRGPGAGGMMSKRQEPEGAPASASVNSLCNSSGSGLDLRKELISASKKRNANIIIGGSNQELTQELSEFRQETRQYCDYRRAPRQSSLSPARFMQSSSSDIFPISSRRKGGSSYSGGSKMSSRSTVHPEVVCDIPVKPHPYMVNASRLSGSNVNLVSEERPSSVLGSTNNLSSPSSVISDNYRRDWAHHYRGSGGSVIQGGRASSVISLHSAPGYASSVDNFRNSTSDLSRFHHHHHGPSDLSSPRFLRDRGNHLARQYSTSPPSSSPAPPRGFSPNDSNDAEPYHLMDEKSTSRASPVRITSRSNTTVISIGAHIPHSSKADPVGVCQPQPYNKVKGYRPVSFKPSSAAAAVS